MTAVREKNIIEFNEIFTNPESQSESDTETDCESDIGENSESNTDTLDEPETSEYSDPNVESPPEVSDDEDVPSSCSSICTSRLWTKSNFKPKLFQFQNNDCGIVCDLNGESPLDFFKLFFDEKLIHIIIDETNKFQVNSSDKHISSSSHQAKWIPTDFEEMYLFLATFMLMAHMKKFRIKDYWSTDPLIATPIFGDIMPRGRFLLLLKFLHFNDNTYQPEGDRSYKIKPVVQDLKQKFRRVFVPYQNLCIDESLVLHKGRLSFKQYIPSKRSRFGIKLFVLCDCHTGYILDFVIYMGSATEIHHRKELGIPGSIVMTLMQPYLQKGHNLFMDNWYSSPILFEELHANSTGACGTVRQNRLGMPHFTDTLQKGGTDYRNTNILLVIKWFDKREVTILSTIHEAKMMNTGKVHWKTNEQIQKPASVIAYNTNMGSVDRSSMQISCVNVFERQQNGTRNFSSILWIYLCSIRSFYTNRRLIIIFGCMNFDYS